MEQQRAAFLTVIVSLALGGCPRHAPPQSAPAPTQPPEPPEAPVHWRESKTGLGFRLSDALPETPPPAASPRARSLTVAQTQELLRRLPPMTRPAEVKQFALRGKSLPAPRPGETLATDFPPAPVPRPTQFGPPKDAPLSVERFQPEGAVDLVPELSVTFSEPMVELTSHAELAKLPIPVQLSPAVPGHWSWLGTQTVVFEPDQERFPLATDYQVRIPAETKSAAGKPLTETKEWKFQTPTLKLKSVFPDYNEGPQKLDPLLFASFNQRVDPDQALAKTILRATNGSPNAIALRRATAEEIEGNSRLRQLTQAAKAGQWLAFRAVDPLPVATQFELVFPKGFPSAEGPKTSEQDQSRSFYTYNALSLERASCAWGEGCAPGTPWELEFNNPIDPKHFDREGIRVDPPMPGFRVEVQGTQVVIHGHSKGRTKYTITVAPGLRDTFGQVLTEPATRQIAVAAAEPTLFEEQDKMILSDPAYPGKLEVFSVNRPSLRVRLFQVTPSDWHRYLQFRDDWDYTQKLTQPPGKLISDQIIHPRKASDELVETSVDLSRALTGGVGQVFALVEPTTPPKRDASGGIEREWVRCWIQETRIGLQAFWDHEALHAWTTTLGEGHPLPGAEISLLGTPVRGVTDPGGLGRLPLPQHTTALVAQLGSDLVFMPTSESPRGGLQDFALPPPADTERWLLFEDRGLYKPGEIVHLKGWVRRITGGQLGDVELSRRTSGKDANYIAYDGQGAELAKGNFLIDETGGFDGSFAIPKNANLGSGRIDIYTTRGGREVSETLRIEEFRRPEFEITAQTSEGPHVVGQHAIATVTAAYYAGGGLPNADVKWTVRAQDATYAPPNLGAYQFGKAPLYYSFWNPQTESPKEEWQAHTAAGGSHQLRIDFDAMPVQFPRELSLEATVTDVNRQAWTARTKALVHPANVTVGLKSQSRFVKAGQNLVYDLIVTDLEGKPVSGRAVDVRGARLEWDPESGDYRAQEANAESCHWVSTESPGNCTLPTHDSGQFLVSARVTDSQGRKSLTESRVWVMGPGDPGGPKVPQGKLELIPDKTAYRGGDTARLLVMAPFAPAEGVLTVRREGIVEIRRVSFKETTELVEVKLQPEQVPNVWARLDLVGAEPRENEAGDRDPTLPQRPAFASGIVQLKIPPTDRSLAISLNPGEHFAKPGAKTQLGIDVKDAQGQPVADARLAVVVVDEAVLALTQYPTPDPLEAFYTTRGEGTQDLELRFRIALMGADADRHTIRARTAPEPMKRKDALYPLAAMSKSAPTGRAMAAPSPQAEFKREKKRVVTLSEVTLDDEAATGQDAPLKLRSNWDALAAFIPSARTDAQGHTEVKVNLPDNLTRYRVMVVGAAGQNRFGSSEGSITARLPLMVRPSPPRFLNFGDRFELPVVLQNQSSSALQVDVVARSANLDLVGSRGLRVSVPANDRVEVRFPAAAARPGTARFQIGAVSSAGTDASEHELPVWTPATTEAFATYGVIDQGSVAQPVRAPRDAVKDWGSLQVTTSSTALQGLTDAVLYLVKYPYECNEQLSSRVVSIAALRDVLSAFKAPGLPATATLLASMTEDIKKIQERQHWSGGWDYWSKDRTPDPFVSIHVMHALVVAKQKGFPVPLGTYSQGLQFLRRMEQHIPGDYPESVRQVLRAYSLYVLDKAGESNPKEARHIIEQAGGISKLPVEAVGWLWSVLSGTPDAEKELTEIRQWANNRVTETAGTAHFVTQYSDGSYLLLASDRRADGVLLDALIEDQPNSDLIPKIVKGLLAHRDRGRWTNTQENAFILLALDRYFATYEKATPDFLAQAWLGEEYLGQQKFQGRTTEYQETTVPMALVAGLPQPSSLLLTKEGPGRLYYRFGMEYAPQSLTQTPADHGFAVSRTYEAVDHPQDVKQDAQGVWHVKLGATVRVRLGMVARTRRYHVALVDPIPAGFEPLNPALATSPTLPPDPSKGAPNGTPWWWSRAWYDHQNLRNERVEAFTSLLWEGVYDYTYVARATTPGNFIVPATKAEEMYAPETFGRGGSDRVLVE